ncbi:pyridoxal phosphate-dependent aminotransferase [Qiania dongpingensis]|uniref:Aminotransferase class I/II-fold pyridoxal phosphate-dependent enzyme n=1 Tax=Qiania dongpingensis TaxID=2763669 RepID=A0A7G9G4D0_9FIRM|nr:threonine-phosphate decarboxylase [Qiania dongpingensis]QNM05662.1 aminotransferase class I/II-fold pyridoxal phosphate-dependent enzyme [Qiania dongpingensis]
MKHIHGGNIYQYGTILDFSANLNPLGMPEGVKGVARESIDRSEHYPDPDCTELREAIGRTERICPEHIICGNGAAELIFLLAAAKRPKQALLTAPSFAEYGQALEAFGCRCRYYPLKREQGFQIGRDYLDALTEETDIAFLCNPNNPTGILTSRDFLKEVLLKCRRLGIFLVLDECFLELTGEKERVSMVGSISEGGIFLLRAFTKSYAMAGLRLGYGMTEDTFLLEKMNELRQPWSVSVPAQAAGIQALKETDFLRASVRYIRNERQWLLEQMRNYPLTVYGGSANYLFFHSDRKDLKEAMVRLGILIRDCGNYQGLCPGYYRIAVRTRQENEVLLKALGQIYNAADS